MLIDARTLPSGTVIEADVCIVGTGPAGLVVAGALEGTGLRVAVLERGGLPGRPGQLGRERVPVTPDSDFEPPPHVPSRFGGAANEWIVRLPWMHSGVRMVPLSPLDLERRSWVPNSGWPISWDELERYYRRANDVLGLDGWNYSVDEWAGDGDEPLQLEPHGFTTAMERFPRARLFTRDRLSDMKRSEHVTVYLNAPVGNLCRSGDRVEELEIDNGTRARLRVRSSYVVLAGGGLRTPRLLLTADDGRGIGNDHDMLGRYYMDHLRVATGAIMPSKTAVFKAMGLYDLVAGAEGPRAGKIVPTAELLRREELLNSAAMVLPRPNDELLALFGRTTSPPDRPPPRRWSSSTPRTALQAVVVGTELAIRQRRVVPRVDAGWSRLTRSDRVWSHFWVEHQIEQAPDPSNRIMLADRIDKFGRREIELCWKWSDGDLASLAATQSLFGTAIEGAGLGRFIPETWSGQPDVTTPDGAFHPMGGTRMSTDPKRGVVDPDGRVHGTPNVFVVGSSVFPTGGYANPALTIVALALRATDRLRRELTSAPTITTA